MKRSYVLMTLLRQGNTVRAYLVLLIVAGAVGGIIAAGVPAQLMLVVLIGGVAFAFFIDHPEYLLYSMVLLAPFHFFITRQVLKAPSLAGGAFSLGGLFQDIWPLGLAVVWLTRGLIQGRLTVKKSPLLVAVLVWVAWGTLHLVSDAPLSAALFGMRSLGRYSVLVVVLPSFVTKREQVNRILLAAFLGAVLAVVASAPYVPQFLSNLSSLQRSGFDVASLPPEARFTGIYMTSERSATQLSNPFAIALALMAVYGISMFFLSKSRVRKGFYLFGVGCQVLFILLTFSRRGYFTLVMGLVLVVFLSERLRRRIPSLAVSAIVLLVLVVLVLSSTPTGRLIMSRSTERLLKNASMGARTKDWRFLISGITESVSALVWGHGLGSTGPVSQRFGLPDSSAAHNHYLMIMYNMGILGLIWFVWLLRRAMKLAHELLKEVQDPRLQGTVLGCFGIVVLLALNGVLGTTFEAYPNDLYFWMALGLLATIHGIEREQPNTDCFTPGSARQPDSVGSGESRGDTQ